MQDLTGRVIKAYELQELIGEGGFGAVYKARQQMINREVAVKIILPHYANQPEFIRRFETEAQLVARLEHPYIVPLYDYWREPSGAYLVMRYLRGGNFQEKIKATGGIALAEAGRIINQICEALVVAHRQNVIHRDLKPENILLDEEGNAYLSDFGIAKELGVNHDLTQNNAILGSPAYLSPEQVRGEAVTPQSDIYALGIVLYEMLSGGRPFKDATPAAQMYKHLSEPIPDISANTPGIPATVNAVLQRATAKEANDRYRDTIEFARAFRSAIKMAVSADDWPSVMQTSVVVGESSGSIHVPDPENPYKGLRAFQQSDADEFFGRDSLIESILNRMQESTDNARFLAVVGPSGSGKSSVIKAGVIPRLRAGVMPHSDRWFVVEMLPGIDPMEELEAALLRVAVNPPESLLEQLNADERGLLRAIKRVLPGDDADSELLIVIDQLEELFTLVDDEATRRHVLDSLYTAVMDPRSRVRVIVTLRADFYDRPLQYPRFGQLMRQRTEVVLPMDAEDLEQAITGPAKRAGLHLENGLVTAIVADVNEQPGALPLLQYALTELFERRKGQTLTTSAYSEIGGTMGALARRADELYAGLGEEAQAAASQMFLRLVTLGEGTEDTRRRAILSELLSIGDDPDEMNMVIEAFGRYRLLTFDHDPGSRSATVEVAHEALIRQWGTLRGWLAESRDDVRTQRRVSAIAEDWRNNNYDNSYLVRGSRLQQFEAWRNRTRLALNDLERQYLQACIDQHQRMEAKEAERRNREIELERRSRDRLRALVMVMSVAAVVSFVLAIFAFSQQQEAQSAQSRAESAAEQELLARTEAEQSALQAQSLAVAANARNTQIQHETTLALSLALAANEKFTPPSLEVLRVLATTAYSPGVRARFEGHEGTVLSGDISTDGNMIASASADGTLRLWDGVERELIRVIETDDEVLTTAKFSPDGQTVATAGTGGVVMLYDVATGELLQTLSGHSDMVTSLDFSADGARLLSGSVDHTMRLWDVDTGETEQVFEGSDSVIFKVALSADGEIAASGHGDTFLIENAPGTVIDRRVRVWDVASGEIIHAFDLEGGWVRTVAISPDSQMIAGATWNAARGGTVHLWDRETGEEVLRMFGHNDLVTGLTFDDSGDYIYSVSWDRSLRVWDTEKGIEVDRFDVFGDLALDVALSAGGEYAAVFTGNIGGNELLRERERSVDPSVWMIDLRTRAQIYNLTGSRDWIWGVTAHPEGDYAVSSSGVLRPQQTPNFDNLIRVWNVQTGELVRELTESPHTSTVESVTFSADGSRFVSAGWDGMVVVWSFDAEAGDATVLWQASLPEADVIALNAGFSPDGSLLAVGVGNGSVVVFDATSGELLRQFGDHADAVAGIVFNPDGETILTGSYDRTAALWDATTGERLVTFEGHTDRVNDVAFTPDGSRVLTASWDVTARVWDTATGDEIRQFAGHSDRLQAVKVSADGLLVLTGGADTTMRLWDIETAQEVFQFEGHTNWVSQVAFLADGLSAISSGQDNTLRVWRLPISADEIVDWAQSERYVRPLTCAEREQFRVTPLCES